MSEVSAKGKRGFLLLNPFTWKHFFRIYDPDDKRKFKDYRLAAEDIEIEILCGGLSLYDGDDEEKARLDWSSEVLGKKK
jgi:hypothetical protein